MADIEERSFVAEGAPLDDGQVRSGDRTGIRRRSGSTTLTLRTSGEEWAPENAKATATSKATANAKTTATPKATANAKVKWPG
jgi:hypothetical protein